MHASGSHTWRENKDIKEGDRIDDTGRGIHVHEKIIVRLEDGSLIETTPGRVMFNSVVPKELGFQNYSLRKKRLGELVLEIYKKVGMERTVHFLDDIKQIGFEQATRSGLSMGIADVIIPDVKRSLIVETNVKVALVTKQYEDGVITDGERKSKIISIWTEITEILSDLVYDLVMKPREGEPNPLYLMIDSGARGNKSQLRQLGALRGLMAKPSGEIIESPITSNFREGLSVLEYFISSHGARKGLSDTALKTADSGYLTRRLVDVAQDVLINEEDCGTLGGIEVAAIKQGQEELLPLKDRIFGRTISDDLYMPGDNTKLIAKAGEVLTREQAEQIDDAGVEGLKIRSTLTCESRRGVCSKCYGFNLANGRRVAKGEAVGIIAAQSIGEPGTQLTMRTFHLGGIASSSSNPEVESEHEGILIYQDVRTVKNQDGVLVSSE